MRYATYIRTSSEDQIGNFSLDAQHRAIEAWITAQAGILVQVYKDEAHSGRTIDRPAFQQMRKDAAQGKFDAIVVHKFDRFARNRTDALAVKSLLRYDYSIKVFSVSEPSGEDGAAGALTEGVLESMADWYSKNLATEVAKSKKERSLQGLHNNGAPFGMKKNADKVLVPDEGEITGLRLAFELYATGDYSDNEVAHILNEQGYKTKRGRPFSKDTVRDMLQNQIYLGKVSYQPCERTEDGERTWTAPVEWFPGQHAAVIDEAIFMKCQQVRDRRVRHRKPTTKYNSYLLRNLIYCYQCCTKRPSTNPFPSYGKMRAQAYRKNEYKCYRCRAREMGYVCSQPKVKVEKIDQQVIDMLMQLTIPDEWRQKIIRAIGELLGEKDLSQRLEEIRAIIKRMDSRWDLGFVTDEAEFMQQRRQLQQELEQLTPLENNQLERATDFFDNFDIHWHGCGSDVEAQAVLLRQIVERVYVEGEKVVAITLRANCYLAIGQKINGSTEFSVDPFITLSTSALRDKNELHGLDEI